LAKWGLAEIKFSGYLDQQLALLNPEKSLMRAVWPDDDPTHTEQKMRDLLGSFGLQGEIVEQPVKELSGGEKSRAALAKLRAALGDAKLTFLGYSYGTYLGALYANQFPTHVPFNGSWSVTSTRVVPCHVCCLHLSILPTFSPATRTSSPGTA